MKTANHNLRRRLTMAGTAAIFLAVWTSPAEAAAQTTPPPQQPNAAAVPAPQYSAGVSDVVKMATAKVDTSVIEAFIRNSSVPYDLGANEIVALKERGVPTTLITAMIERGGALRAQSAGTPSQPAQEVAKATTPAPQAAAEAPSPPYAPDFASGPVYYDTASAYQPVYSYPIYSYPYSYTYWYYNSYPWYWSSWYWPYWGCYPYRGYCYYPWHGNDHGDSHKGYNKGHDQGKSYQAKYQGSGNWGRRSPDAAATAAGQPTTQTGANRVWSTRPQGTPANPVVARNAGRTVTQAGPMNRQTVSRPAPASTGSGGLGAASGNPFSANRVLATRPQGAPLSPAFAQNAARATAQAGYMSRSTVTRPTVAPAPSGGFRPNPGFSSAPSFRASPAPSFRANPAPSFRASPAPSFRASSAPSFRGGGGGMGGGGGFRGGGRR